MTQRAAPVALINVVSHRLRKSAARQETQIVTRRKRAQGTLPHARRMWYHPMVISEAPYPGFPIELT